MKIENTLREDIGFFIRSSRQEKSLSASQLGDLIKISQQQISRYERGINTINIEMLNKILIALDKSWSDFFFNVMAYHSKEIERLKTKMY
ncbi:helix-turn-helix domain-containing protein [Providencia sp. PROV129]|uniref:helix-turn-helix domain-containing protein n=1 Tax=Providencia sp. PROV129 TaxID=2949839 RepID=UPI0023492301|nr:helix-turn-helix transcriptional regulator [Providencia sp. PROV129]